AAAHEVQLQLLGIALADGARGAQAGVRVAGDAERLDGAEVVAEDAAEERLRGRAVGPQRDPQREEDLRRGLVPAGEPLPRRNGARVDEDGHRRTASSRSAVPLGTRAITAAPSTRCQAGPRVVEGKPGGDRDPRRRALLPRARARVRCAGPRRGGGPTSVRRTDPRGAVPRGAVHAGGVMRAVVTREAGVMEVGEVPDPGAPGAGQVLLRPEAVGICGSDLHFLTAELRTPPA